MSTEVGVLTVGTRSRSRALDRGRMATGVALGVIVIVAAGLRLALFSQVEPNPFYDAAVRSMGMSWHNFFYGAFDPSAATSVDKTPVDLWLQVASTKIFGFTSSALRLPEALAGLLAVPLLFDTVRRMFGRAAGLLAAAALAVLPLAVVTARSDTMDSLMMLCLIGAAWCSVRAVQTGRWWAFIGAGAVMGLAFNVKLFEALLVIPPLVLLVALGTTLPWRALLVRAAGATAAFVGVAMSWVTTATLLPGAKPFPIGSADGTVMNVVFIFNGLNRIAVPAISARATADPPGVWRLTSVMPYDRLVGTSLVAAIVLGGVALAYRLPHLWRGRGPEARLHRAGAAFIALWLILGTVLFSHVSRLHPRYIEAMTPAIAAAIGIGMGVLLLASRRRAVAGLLLAAAVAAVVFAVRNHGAPAGWAVLVAEVCAGACVLVALVMAVVGASRRPAVMPLLAAAAIGAVFVMPASASVHAVKHGESDSGRPGAMRPARLTALSSYLLAHQGATHYEVAAENAFQAGSIIAHDGRPVLILTTITGRQIVSPAQLRAKIATGQVRYMTVAAHCPNVTHPSACPPVLRWAQQHAKNVSHQAHVLGRPRLYRFTAPHP